MAPIAKELEVPNSLQPETAAPASGGNKAQPAALEIPVTVNGARTIAGSDKREPFSENTKTVLVFSHGAVIRLSSAVTSGQLLFLTNEKSKKEVVCQVVKSKNYSNVSGYVELEFTEAAPGFWGLRFPANAPIGMTPTAAKTVSNSATPLLKSLEEKLADVPVQAQAVATESVSVPAVSKAAAVTAPETAKVAAVIFEAQQKEQPAAPVVAEKPAASEPKIPTIMDFLIAEEKAAQLEASEISSVAEKTPTAVSSNKLEVKAEQPVIATVAELKNQSTALVAPTATKSSTRPATPASTANPAPGTYTFDFAADQVKIPAWLEPLARNSAASSAVPHTGEFETKPAEKKADEAWLTESLPTRPEIEEAKSAETEFRAESTVEGVSEDGPAESEYSNRPEAVLTLSSEGHTPNFGSTLSMNSRGEQQEKSSSIGLVLKLAAVVLIVAAAGGWYWYSNRGASVSANGNAAVQPETVANPETDNSAISSKPANKSLNTPPAAAAAADRNLPSASPAGLSENSAALPAGKSGNPSGIIENPARVSSGVVQPEVAPAKKAAIGELHLAAPVVKHPNTAHQNNASEPDPVISDAAISGGSAAAASLLSSKGSEPSAPIAIGGDVKPGRLLSSVAPVYPQMARSQRVSGSVVLDALIDADGRVSAMKIISGSPLLHQAAMDAVRQWKYQPAMLNGQPTTMHLTVTLQFKLP